MRDPAYRVFGARLGGADALTLTGFAVLAGLAYGTILTIAAISRKDGYYELADKIADFVSGFIPKPLSAEEAQKLDEIMHQLDLVAGPTAERYGIQNPSLTAFGPTINPADIAPPLSMPAIRTSKDVHDDMQKLNDSINDLMQNAPKGPNFAWGEWLLKRAATLTAAARKVADEAADLWDKYGATGTKLTRNVLRECGERATGVLHEIEAWLKYAGDKLQAYSAVTEEAANALPQGAFYGKEGFEVSLLRAQDMFHQLVWIWESEVASIETLVNELPPEVMTWLAAVMRTAHEVSR